MISNFTKAVNLFYEQFLKGTSESIKNLANIQKTYPAEYEKLKEIQKDPSLIFDNIEGLSEEEKDKLLVLFTRISKFEAKMLRLFDLSAEEKEKLAEELKEFIETIKIE